MNRGLRAFGYFLGGVFLCVSTSEIYAKNSQASIRKAIKIKKSSYLKRDRSNNQENYSIEKIDLLSKKRRETILEIQKFIREARDKAQKATLKLRLANLYMEDYYAGLSKAQQLFDRKYEAYQKLSPKKRKKIRPPKIDNTEAIASLDKARLVYKDLLKRFPNHPQKDEILFFMAAAALDKSAISQAMKYFAKLTKNYPKSKYSNDALVELGDYYFDQSQFKKAKSYYQQLMDKKYLPLLPYATYKSAWCWYNLGNPQKSLANFKWVIKKESLIQGTSSIQIRKEALKDITLPFVELKLVKESVNFFKSYGDPHFRNGLQIMASLYLEAGETDKAIFLWESLLKSDPNHPKNPSYDINIVDAYKLAGKDNKGIQRLFESLPKYMKGGSWYELNLSRPKIVKAAEDQFENTARKFAFQYHARAQKTKKQNLYNLSRELYSKYLKYFPNTVHSAKIRFYLAEILYKQKMFAKAALEYYRVYKNPNAGNLRLDAIRYALSGLSQEINNSRVKKGLSTIDSNSRVKLKTNSMELEPYTGLETQFLQISSEFLKRYPRNKDAPNVLYEKAYLQYAHRDLSKAYTNFWKFVDRYPQHAASHSAAHLILDILNRKKDYSKLVASAQKFLSMKALANNKSRQAQSKFSAEISDILRRSELKRISILEKDGQYKKAAKAYMEYTKAYGRLDEALYEKALFNAGANFSKAGMTLSAVEAQEKFLRRFPKSRYNEKMFLNVASAYEKLANFSKAAEYFYRLASRYPKNPQSKNALRLAGLYYWGSGKESRAESTMKEFTARYPARSDRRLVERDLLDLYASRGDIAGQIGIYLKQRAERGVPITEYVTLSLKIAELQLQINEAKATKTMQSALSIARKNAGTLKRSPQGREAIAQLTFWSIRNRERQFQSLQLRLPENVLQANLEKKLSLLKKLEKDYAYVASFGSGEWGVASLYKTAKAYRTMAQAVLRAPVPGQLSAQQVEQYRQEVKKTVIDPFNEKALNYAERCLDKTQELNLFAEWTAKCFSIAGSLNSKRYKKIRTLYLPPLYTGLLLPNRNESKIKIGSIENYNLPFYSSGLFEQKFLTRALAKQENTMPNMQFDPPPQATRPVATTYRVLANERKAKLKRNLKSNRPKRRKLPTFAYLNLLRLINPKNAITTTLNTIEKDPGNHALHNLLALAYMESGNYPAAKVIWLSLIARGAKESAIWNNLGVLAALEGKEDQAIDYFNEAILLPSPGSARANLGFIALKYHNGFEAKRQFQKALENFKKDPTLRVASIQAQIQNRELETAKKQLPQLSKQYRKNPYARLSLAYYLIDLEKMYKSAKKVVADYMDKYSAKKDPQFRRILSEAKGEGDGMDLPTIE